MLKEREKKRDFKTDINKKGMRRFKNKVKKVIGYNSGFALYDKEGFMKP